MDKIKRRKSLFYNNLMSPHRLLNPKRKSILSSNYLDTTKALLNTNRMGTHENKFESSSTSFHTDTPTSQRSSFENKTE